jgi:PCFT/HCP family folate transporter-like MFS transporter 1/3
MRTLRIGVLNLSLTIGISFGVALSGILFQKLGFYGIYSICSTMYFMGILYGIFILRDPSNKEVSTSVDCQNSKITAHQSICTNIREFFDLKHIKNAFGVTFKKGHDNRRLRIIMMMLVLMIIMGPMTG